MKKNGRFALKMTFLILATAVLVAAGSVYAWFVEGSGAADSVIVGSGDIDLNARLYTASEGRPAVYTAANPDRAAYFAENYIEVSKTESTAYPSFIQGTGAQFILTAENASSEGHVSVETGFAPMRDAFFAAAENENAQEAFIEANTARIMFALNRLRVRIFTPSEDGYSLSSSSDAAECVGGVTKIECNAASATDFHMWELDGGERFLEGIILAPGQRMEAEFIMTCLQTETVFARYAEFWRGYVAANGIEGDSAAKILALAERELRYVGADSGESGEDISFTLKKIYVLGTLTDSARGEGL